MLREKAQVIAYENGIAQVRFQPVKGCGGCSENKGCGVSALSSLTGSSKDYVFQVASLTPLRVGQWIEIGLPERSLLTSVFWLYVVPLFAVVLSSFFSEYFLDSEGIRVIFIMVVAAMTFMLVHIYSKKLHQRAGYQPVLLRVL